MSSMLHRNTGGFRSFWLLILGAAGLSFAISFGQTVLYQDDFVRTGRQQPGGHTQVLKASTPLCAVGGDSWWKAQ